MDKKLDKLVKAVQAAQRAISNEESDSAVHSASSGEYAVLIKGAEAQIQLLYAVMTSVGLRNTRRNRELFGKAQIVLLDLLHKAFACGVLSGRQQSHATNR